MADKEKIFVGRVYDDKYAIAKIQYTREDLKKLEGHLINDKVSVLVKKSKNDKLYSEVDTFVPRQQPQEQQVGSMQELYNKVNPAPPEEPLDDLPF